MKKKRIFIVFSLMFMLVSFVDSSNNDKALIHTHEDNCCSQELVVDESFDDNKIHDLRERIVFTTSNSDTNLGEVTIKANYKPVGAASDTLWVSSDTSKIECVPDFLDSSICKLVALNRFDDVVTVTATSKFYSNIKFNISVTFKDKIIIQNNVSSLTLNSTKQYNCPNSYNYVYESKSLDYLFTLNGSTQGLTYNLSSSSAIISGSTIKANTATNTSLTLTAVSNEDKSISSSIPVNIVYGVNSSSTHSYSYSSYNRRYETNYSYSYGSWQITKAATCTSVGTKERSVEKITKKLAYDTDKYVCNYCSSYYYGSEYRYSSGDITSSSYSTESVDIPKISHDFRGDPNKFYFENNGNGTHSRYVYYYCSFCNLLEKRFTGITENHTTNGNSICIKCGAYVN